MDDPYQNNVNQQVGGEYAYTQDGGGQDGYPYQTDYPPQDEDAASDATEGADEDNQMYEGEYQGIPHPDEIKEARRAARMEARRKARMAAQQEEEEEDDNLPEQYEAIMEDCGHGCFQWMQFLVLGLALMAEGVDSYVVGFVMPSAEKDMCMSNADKGLLGKKNSSVSTHKCAWFSIKLAGSCLNTRLDTELEQRQNQEGYICMQHEPTSQEAGKITDPPSPSRQNCK